MRKFALILVLLLLGFAEYAQNPKSNNILAVEIARQRGDFFDSITSLSWPFIWDLPVSTFDKEFIVVEVRKNGRNPFVEYSAITKAVYAGETVLVRKKSDEERIFFISQSDDHGDLFAKGLFSFIEIKNKNGYCGSYEMVWDLGDYNFGKIRDNDKHSYYYSEVDGRGRVTLFDDFGFTGNEIINSQRNIRPKDPWRISYTDSSIKEISNSETKYSFDWHDDYLQSKRVRTVRNAPEHIIHRLSFSDPDQQCRWTKAVLYDYDVIEDSMVPVYTVKRVFVPIEQFEKYKRVRYNLMTIAKIDTGEVPESEKIPFQLVEVKPTFNGGDANDFSKWVNSHLIYPEIAKANGIQGRVLLRFTINTDGHISDVNVIRGIDTSLDAEAVRVVSSAPEWKPGESRGVAVPVTYTFPVIFQLK